MLGKKDKIIIGITGAILITAFLLRKRALKYFYYANNEYFMPFFDNNFRQKLKKLIIFADKQGYYVLITSGHRGYDNRSMDNSLHNFGRAVDINLIPKDGKESIKMLSSREKWLSTGVPQYAKNILDLEWGGDYTEYVNQYGQKGDNVHFETKEDVKELTKKGMLVYKTKKELFDNGYLV